MRGKFDAKNLTSYHKLPHVSFGFTTQLYEYVYYPDLTEISLSDLDNIQELTQQLGLTVSRTKWSKVIALCV